MPAWLTMPPGGSVAPGEATGGAVSLSDWASGRFSPAVGGAVEPGVPVPSSGSWAKATVEADINRIEANVVLEILM